MNDPKAFEELRKKYHLAGELLRLLAEDNRELRAQNERLTQLLRNEVAP